MRYHLIFDSEYQTCKVYNGGGVLLLKVPMHDKAVNGPGFERWGRCPRGVFPLGEPVRVDVPSMGLWFIPVLNTPGRAGIGIHGGGTGLPDPFAPLQGWEETHGCLRAQNEDLERLVQMATGGGCLLSVEGP